MKALKYIKACVRHIVLIAVVLGTSASISASDLASDRLDSEGDKAILRAIEVVNLFGEYSRMRSETGEDLSQQFSSIMSLNALIPLDFIEGRQDEMGTPSKYMSEFSLRNSFAPIGVSTNAMKGKSTAVKMSASNAYRVTLYVKRRFNMLATAEGFKALDKPNEVVHRVEVQVSEDGIAKIDRVIPLKVVKAPGVSLDLVYSSDLSSATAMESDLITGLDGMSIKASDFSVKLGYHFNPFRSAIDESEMKTYYTLGLGLDFINVSSPSLSLSSATPDYLDEDDVIVLVAGGSNANISAVSENDDDFTLYIDGDFKEEVLKSMSVNANIGVGFLLGPKSSLELGIGMLLGGEEQVDVNDNFNIYTVYRGGDFAEHEVTISPQEATYLDWTTPVSDIDPYYDFDRSSDGVTTVVTMQTSSYVELSFIQMLTSGSVGIGLKLTARQHLSPILSREGNEPQDLTSLALRGSSRLGEYTTDWSPLFLGLGIRIQKNR